MPYSIMLDSGHGGRDPGAVYNQRQEKDDTLRLVLAIGEILQNRGIDVLYTRTEDIYESPFEKAMEANTSQADYFLSIHRNSYPTDNTVSGVESLIYDKSGIKFELAENINEQLEAVGFVNLGVKERPNLVVLKRTQMPAVLVEVGFLNSDADNRLFDENFQDIAEAIAAGVIDTLGPDPNEISTEVSVPTVKPAGESAFEASSDDGSSISPPASEAKDPAIYHYHVQTGAFRMELYANRLLEELMEQKFPAFTVHTGNIYRVYVGAFSSLSDAIQMEQLLKQAGYPTVIIA